MAKCSSLIQFECWGLCASKPHLGAVKLKRFFTLFEYGVGLSAELRQ